MAFKVEVDGDKCIGCGSCEHVAGEFFEVKETNGRFIAVAKKNKVDKIANELKEAKEICPVEAITITEDKAKK